MRSWFLLDPNPADGGGAADGGSADGGDGGDSGDGSAGKQSGSDASLNEAQLKQLREVIGLKEGQSISNMITGASKRHVGEALGLKEGEDFADAIGRVIADLAVKDEGKGSAGDGDDGGSADDDQSGKAGKDGKGDDELAGLKSEFGEVKSAMQSIQKERDDSRKELAEERRKSAIRDELSKFELRPETKKLVTKVFEEGIEGPKMKLDDKNKLIVEDEDGHPQAADAYLKGYFEENSWALGQQKATGTGARSKGGADTTPSNVEVDIADIGESPEKIRKARAEDPEGTAQKLQTQLQEKGSKYGGRWGGA